jgi:hypothetical protein
MTFAALVRGERRVHHPPCKNRLVGPEIPPASTLGNVRAGRAPAAEKSRRFSQVSDIEQLHCDYSAIF